MNEEAKTQSTAESGGRRLYRSVANRRVAGVCGGVAEYFKIDPLIVRLIWFIAIFVNGIGLFAYVAAWIILPESHQPVTVSPPVRSYNSHYVWGAVLLLLGVVLLADRLNWDFLVPWHWHYFLPHWFNWGVLFSLFVIILGVLLIFRGNESQAKSSAIAPSSWPLAETVTEPADRKSEPYHKSEPEPRIGEKRLTRALDERMIGGVCGGLAKYFNIDPSLVRIGYVLLTLFSWVVLGIVVYIVMMIVVPEESPAAKKSASPVGNTA